MLNPDNTPGRWGCFTLFLRGKLQRPEAAEGRYPRQGELGQLCPGRGAEGLWCPLGMVSLSAAS